MTWEEFERLRQLEVEFEVGPIYEVPKHSPRPPQPVLPAPMKPALAPVVAPPKLPSVWETWRRPISRLLLLLNIGGLLFLAYRATLNPAALNKLTNTADKRVLAFYESLLQVLYRLFERAWSLHSVTAYPNINIIIHAVTIFLSVVIFTVCLYHYLYLGTYISSLFKWCPRLVRSWVNALPCLIVVAPFLAWAVIHLFVFGLVNPMAFLKAWLLKKH